MFLRLEMDQDFDSFMSLWLQSGKTSKLCVFPTGRRFTINYPVLIHATIKRDITFVT